MMMMFTVKIPRIPESLNVTLRKHWSARHRIKKEWSDELYLLNKNQRASLRTWAALRLQITAHITICHSRLYDKDNAYGSVKVLVDVLKEQRFCFDDRPEYLHLVVEQEKVPHKRRHTILSIGIEPGEKGVRG